MDFKVKSLHVIHVLYMFDTRFICVLYTWKRNRYVSYLTLYAFYAFDVFFVKTFRRPGAGHAAKLPCATLPGTSGFTLFAPEDNMEIFEQNHDINIT